MQGAVESGAAVISAGNERIENFRSHTVDTARSQSERCTHVVLPSWWRCLQGTPLGRIVLQPCTVRWLTLLCHFLFPLITAMECPEMCGTGPDTPFRLLFWSLSAIPLAQYVALRWFVDPGFVPLGARETDFLVDCLGRFCDDCATSRPLRSKHCRLCKRCVRTHNHHCVFIGKCIGEGNLWLFSVYILWLFIGFLVLLIYPTLEKWTGPGPHEVGGPKPVEFIVYLLLSPKSIKDNRLLLVQKIALFSLIIQNLYLANEIWGGAARNLSFSERLLWRKIPHIAVVNQGTPWLRTPFVRPEVGINSVMLHIFCPRRWCPMFLRKKTGMSFDKDGWCEWEACLDPSFFGSEAGTSVQLVELDKEARAEQAEDTDGHHAML